ncbi:MAG: GatB/YqeY domain-containing protein [Myxococcota bacterium]
MTLVETIQTRTREALKARDDVAKNVLRVVLGEIQLAASRQGKELPDAEGHKIIRKLIASNLATLEVTADPDRKALLTTENELLETLVPKALEIPEIVAALAPVREAVLAAKADGPAMGVAMKHLKSEGKTVEGDAVRAAVAQIRGN